MRLHRIALAKHSATAAAAFDGQGGLHGHGRWHVRSKLIVCTADHAALAMAEALVHLQRSNSIETFNHWEIEVPDESILGTPALPPGWKNDVPFTQSFGDAWLSFRKSVAHFVPSALETERYSCKRERLTAVKENDASSASLSQIADVLEAHKTGNGAT
jgi:RES domain-containing protein